MTSIDLDLSEATEISRTNGPALDVITISDGETEFAFYVGSVSVKVAAALGAALLGAAKAHGLARL